VSEETSKKERAKPGGQPQTEGTAKEGSRYKPKREKSRKPYTESKLNR